MHIDVVLPKVSDTMEEGKLRRWLKQADDAMHVTVSCDHRIIDAVLAGRFLGELKGLLEQPIGLGVA